MRDSTTIPKFFLHVYGDWQTVISAAWKSPFHDHVLNQKPMDGDRAEYDRYDIPCETSADLINAYNAFTSRRLTCEFAVVVKSDDAGCEVFATTGTGYEHPPKRFAMVDVNEMRVSATMAGAIQSAIEILSKAR